MVVAVNTRFLVQDQLEGFGYFTKEVLQRLTPKYPEHQFHFFFERPYSDEFIFSSNVTPHVLSPPAHHPLLWKFWYDVKVPLLLKKIKADVFLSPDGQCSLATRIPQCLVVHDLGFLHHSEGYKKTHRLYLKYYTPRFIHKAKTVATVSQWLKNDIVHHYRTNAEKIAIVYNGVKDIFHPTSFDEQSAIKEKYTGGTEFFICTGTIHPGKNLINLLKAFSVFKRRLQSSMKLVLTGRFALKNNEFLQLLQTYKYKEDVVLTEHMEEKEFAQLVAAAYAMVYPSLFEDFGVPVIEAMKCAVPVLTSKNSAMQESSEGAALYFDPNNVDDIADKLMLIYKDEERRKKLIENGKGIAPKYTWQRTADLLWESLIDSVKDESSIVNRRNT